MIKIFETIIKNKNKMEIGSRFFTTNQARKAPHGHDHAWELYPIPEAAPEPDPKNSNQNLNRSGKIPEQILI